MCFPLIQQDSEALPQGSGNAKIHLLRPSPTLQRFSGSHSSRNITRFEFLHSGIIA